MNIQQEVRLYKENILTSAQQSFEKDLTKRQCDGWRLISITPTKKHFDRISQLTAIYERDNPLHDNPTSNPAHESHPQQRTRPLSTNMSAFLSNSLEQSPSSPGVPVYSKAIFLGLLTTTLISFLLIGLGRNATADHFFVLLSEAGTSLFLGVLISIFIIDWKGFVSLEGLIKWRQMEDKKRNGMGCLFLFLFPIFFFIYLIRAGLNVFQSEGSAFSKEWNAPAPIKRRATIGLVTGTILALISLAFATSTSVTGTNVEIVPTESTPTTITAAGVNVPRSAPSSVATLLPQGKPSPVIPSPLTPKSTPSPTATPLPSTKPAPATGTNAQFDNGTYMIGTDIQPGTYRTRKASSGCYYARLSGFGGATGDILANNLTDTPAIITLLPTDKGFQSSNCGPWTKDLSAITTSKTSFQDGMYIVGTDIQPGTYKSSGQSGCYYARLSGFGGTTGDILANNLTDAPAIITLLPTDKGFQSSNCGPWIKA